MKFKPRSATTRQFIIETTAPIFNRKGYAGTSMSDLTEATHLTKGSIYGNFENKEEVALAAFEYNYAFLSGKIRDRVNAAPSWKGKLMAYVDFYRDAATGELIRTGGCPLLNTGIEADDTHEPLRKKVEKALLTWRNHLTIVITSGIKAGEFKAGTNADKTALTIITMIQGGVFYAKATRDNNHLYEVLSSVEDVIEAIS